MASYCCDDSIRHVYHLPPIKLTMNAAVDETENIEINAFMICCVSLDILDLTRKKKKQNGETFYEIN